MQKHVCDETNINVAGDKIKGYNMNDFHGQLCSYLQINYFVVLKRASQNFSVISGRSHHSLGITSDLKNIKPRLAQGHNPVPVGLSTQHPTLSPLSYRTPINSTGIKLCRMRFTSWLPHQVNIRHVFDIYYSFMYFQGVLRL